MPKYVYFYQAISDENKSKTCPFLNEVSPFIKEIKQDDTIIEAASKNEKHVADQSKG